MSLYYEPKTGTIYASPPRERNVYSIPDTPEVRRKLTELTGPERILWLERTEERNSSGDAQTMAEPEPHEVRPPSTHEEIMSSDNQVIRHYYTKSRINRFEKYVRQVICSEMSPEDKIHNIVAQARVDFGDFPEVHCANCARWSEGWCGWYQRRQQQEAVYLGGCAGYVERDS